MIIDGEQAYPIYKFSFSWTQDTKTDCEEDRIKNPNVWIYKDQPPGRMRNSTGFSMMKEAEMTTEELETFGDEWFKNYSTKKEIPNPGDIVISWSLYYETWVCSWFQHETFDKGQTDQEARSSFEKYVRRHEHYQDNLEKKIDKDGREIVQVSLMGAEDRWRWRGADDEEGNTTSAPCRCKHCKDAGKLRINH